MHGLDVLKKIKQAEKKKLQIQVMLYCCNLQSVGYRRPSCLQKENQHHRLSPRPRLLGYILLPAIIKKYVTHFI